ncbi:MAG: hypothetical protein NTX67_05240 [Burkholderiales bacterium]|jgi:hypothetical protein|nr:hypothetical protein [Burkholderiales bacterium]
MEDQSNPVFDLWLKDQIALIQLDDSKFTQQVLIKIQASELETATPSERWTNGSWMLCVVMLGSILAQYLAQIDTDTFTGPVAESLILFIAMSGAAWQCQLTSEQL